MEHENMVMDEEALEGAVHAKAIVNSISGDIVNVSHEAIPEIGWPAMTMDMPLMENAELMEDVNAGDTVIMMLVKREHGMYAVSALLSEM